MRIDAESITTTEDCDASPRLIDLRDIALLLVAHCTLARASEITAMLWQDLHVEPDGEGSILIRRSKTDQTGEGMIRWLSAEAVSALLRWREAHDAELAQLIADEPERFARLMTEFQRPKHYRGGKHKAKPPVNLVWEPSIYLFRGLATAPVYEIEGYRPNGKAIKRVAKTLGWSLQMTPLAITQIFRKRLKAAGYKPEGIEGFSAHSTRIGSAQDLAREGADLAAIMQAGGWRDPKMAARYTERQAVKQARGVQIMRARPLLRQRAKVEEDES
jgi:integrase